MIVRRLYFIVVILGILSTGLSAEQKNKPFGKQWKKIERYGGDPDFRKALHKKTTKFPPVSLK